MLDYIRIACAVPQVQVANVEKNVSDICAYMEQADAQNVDLLLFPELAMTGYSCGDLFLQDTLLDAVEAGLVKVLECSEKHPQLTAVVGLPVRSGMKLLNCAAVVSGGKVRQLVSKTYLPDHGESNESRWFCAAREGSAVTLAGETLFVDSETLYPVADTMVGIEICEDLFAPISPSTIHALSGAEVILNLAASPEVAGKRQVRKDRVVSQSAACKCIYAFASAGYTESTADVVKKFQYDAGLEVTGDADPWTQAMLYDERTPKRAGSKNELKYLRNEDQPLWFQRTDVTSWDFSGSIQLSLRNDSGARLTDFYLKIIPYYTDGSAAYMAETFEEEIEREYGVDEISIADGDSYSDFYTNDKFDEGIWPHHFTVSRLVYFSGAQLAVSRYRSGGQNVYVDDDQMVFVQAGCGAGESFMNTLPVTITAEEKANSRWEMGIVSRYVLPVYQQHYDLPQGAWLKSVRSGSPADFAGLEKGDIIIGVGDITILGDATLRKARGSILPGETAQVTFWRDGAYYVTEILRPEEE